MPIDITERNLHATEGSPGTIRSDQCLGCQHFQVTNTCDAFPEGIPEAILDGRYDHKLAYPGDQGIRYEPLGVEAGPQAG